jgi:hypothetical protein
MKFVFTAAPNGTHVRRINDFGCCHLASRAFDAA